MNQVIRAPTYNYTPQNRGDGQVDELLSRIQGLEVEEASQIIVEYPGAVAVKALLSLGPLRAPEIINALPEAGRVELLAQFPEKVVRQWEYNQTFPEDSVGRLMDAPHALLADHLSVAEAIECLRDEVKQEFVTYGYVLDNEKRFVGVVVMRDLLFASPHTPITDIMVKNPFSLSPDTALLSAMSLVVSKHFPIYPVCDQSKRIVGLVRGVRLFEAQAIEISAQAGSMVGVEKEEHLGTPWSKSLKFRHPWLQLNLLTAFVAGAVVSIFQNTIDQIVVLAAFLPVLAGQSGNTGCQALAVTLRGMTLGQLKTCGPGRVVLKEGLLGILNGIFVGISAGIGMYILARAQGNPQALGLGLIVFIAMIGSCFVSGLSGALIPLGLKKIGADPATASSIFLTTATDIASMGLLLGLASWMLL